MKCCRCNILSINCQKINIIACVNCQVPLYVSCQIVNSGYQILSTITYWNEFLKTRMTYILQHPVNLQHNGTCLSYCHPILFQAWAETFLKIIKEITRILWTKYHGIWGEGSTIDKKNWAIVTILDRVSRAAGKKWERCCVISLLHCPKPLSTYGPQSWGQRLSLHIFHVCCSKYFNELKHLKESIYIYFTL